MKRLKSVLVSDMERCVVTGARDIHIHHIFGAANRKRSEKYGFVIPLHPYYHNMSNEGIHFNRELDLKWKRKAQAWYEQNIGSRDMFIREFGKSWL